MFNFITDTMEKYYQNRLLDMAHSHYRPGISLEISAIIPIQLFKQNSSLNPSKEFEEVLEFYVDMEMGTCSCIKGLDGSECKHQEGRKYKLH